MYSINKLNLRSKIEVKFRMKQYKKHIGIRLEDEELHTKLHIISKYEGRSANGHILHLIRKDIERFETEHGEIVTHVKK